VKHMRRGLLLLVFCSIPACWAAKTSPVLESVTNNCDGTCTAVFGYNHSGSKVEKIPVGADNRFVGSDSQNVEQPVSFERGRHRSVVTARFGGDRLMWVLDGDSAVALADSADNSCLWTVPKGAWEAARSQLPRHGRSLVENLPDLDTTQLTIGQPFRFYFSGSERREHYASGTAVFGIVNTASEQWLFPLWYKGEVVLHMVVWQKEGRWKWLSTSAYGLFSPELGKLRESWPEEKGYHPFVIECPGTNPIGSFCFSVPELGRHNLTKLRPEPWPEPLTLPLSKTADGRDKYRVITTMDETMPNLSR